MARALGLQQLVVIVVQRLEKLGVALLLGPDRAMLLAPGIGLALIGEGLFSATYHICPNPINFQFDTTFMYTITVLIFSALYQRRHTDVAPTAYVAYIAIGVLIFLNVIGVYWASFGHLLIIFYGLLLIIFTVISYTSSITYVPPWAMTYPANFCRTLRFARL